MEKALEKNETALVRCESYEREEVEERVARAFELAGGPDSVVHDGESVYVKVNALVPTAPEKAVTTHPEVLRAVVGQLQRVTDRVTIGDSPGGPSTRAILKRFYDRTGFSAVAAETGAELDFDTTVTRVGLPEGKMLKSFPICGAAAAADRLVSVSKFKTHMFMNISGAVKNLFGVVPGMNKFTYHSRFSRDLDFADFLVDAALAARPDFHVVDAVAGMDGDGPRVGDPVEMGIIAAGTDPFALDLLMMKLIGHDPRSNRPLAAAIDRGLCPSSADELDVLGEDPAGLAVEGFRLPAKKDVGQRVPGFLMDRFGSMLSLRPKPSRERCTGCRKCAEVCPGNAISMEAGIAVVDMAGCIRCYCCHELCEHDAIDLERPLLMRLIRIDSG